MSKRVIEDGANLRAAKGLAKIIAVAIILVVAAYGDVMYIQAMASKFPSGGPLLIMCYIGAFTSFLSVLYLLMGKSLAFRPGAQMIGAWVVFIAELLIIGMNILLVFNPSPGGLMGAWSVISPASPVLHMIGVALLYFLDPDLKSKHKAMEMQEKMDDSERQVEYEVHNARINLRRLQVDHVSKALEQAVHSPESLASIQQFGNDLNRDLLIELTGRPMTMLPSGARVPGLPGTVSGSLLPPQSSEEMEWERNEQYLREVNDRMAAERERRLASGGEREPFTDESDTGSALQDGYKAELQTFVRRVLDLFSEGRLTMSHLAQAERFLGCAPSANQIGTVGFSEADRIQHVAYVALQKGYTPDDLERFLLRFAESGGDNGKKK